MLETGHGSPSPGGPNLAAAIRAATRSSSSVQAGGEYSNTPSATTVWVGRPKSEKQTKLGHRLGQLRYSDQHVERDYGAFKVRIWRID